MFDLSGLPQSTRDAINASAKWRAFFARKPLVLLGIDNNAKTIKGNKKGFRTAILYLSPSDASGINVCPMAKLAECDVACLHTAGRGAMTNVQMARLRKTLFFHQYRAEFVRMLSAELATAKRKAARDNVTLLVRLNGTSDIEWERIAPSLFTTHSDVQFYDYTKIPNRVVLPANYDLTYSYSGVTRFLPQVQKATLRGMRIAVVFSDRARIPVTFNGMQCVDGDDSDIRHLDAQGVAVALYAKGKAKQDRSGFVVQV